MEANVVLQIDHGVAEVTLNRPEKLNALDFETFDQLVGIGDQLRHEPGIRAVVLSGRGRSFSVGIDLSALAEGEAEILSRLNDTSTVRGNFFQHCSLLWRELPFPVIAAVQGHALGGGMQIALGADIRIVAPKAQLSLREIVWGIVPDMAGTVLLRGLVREDLARDLLVTGRTVSGTEAFSMGLATRLSDDPQAEALVLAREIASHSPHAVRAAKRLANLGAEGASVETMLAREAKEQKALIVGSNHREALAAYADKRPPRYLD